MVTTRKKKAVAVLLAPADDDDLEGLLMARSPRFQAMLERSRRSIKAGKGLSQEAFWKAVAEGAPKQGTQSDGAQKKGEAGEAAP